MKPIVMAQLISTFNVGGAEALALEIARHTDRRLYTPIAIALRKSGEMEERFKMAGVATQVIGSREGQGLDIRGVFRLAKTLKDNHVRILHCHNRVSQIYGALSARIAGVPVIVCTRHAAPTIYATRGRPTLLERLAILLIDHMAAVSEEVYGTAIRLGRMPRGRSSVIVNGVDLNCYSTARMNASGMNLICVARLSPEKRHDLLLDALAAVKVEGSCPRLLLVGDGPAREKLQSRVRDLNLQDRVDFLGMRSDVPALLSQAHMFCLASDTEGMPMTIIEAMAAGLPVVATRVGGIPELVGENETGLLVPPGDVQALAQAIQRLADDQALRSRMGAAARALAEKRFDISQSIQSYESVYMDILLKKGYLHNR